MKHTLMATAGLALAALVSMVVVEGSYRVYLWGSALRQAPSGQQIPGEKLSFSFYGEPAPWRYDADYGFKFNEGAWRQGAVREGEFNFCEVTGVGNRYGNAGINVGDYESADFKVAMFGSSYTLVHITGEDSTAILLQKALSHRLGKKVHVLNFSRDATGMLSMFDIAKLVSREFKPDLLLFVFNTPALVYGRHWRVVKRSSGDFSRMYFTTRPNGDTPPNLSLPHTNVLTPRASQKWCDEMTEARARGDVARLRGDPVVIDMANEYRSILRDRQPPVIPSRILSTTHSVVFNRIRRGDALHGIALTDANPLWTPITINDYEDDPGFQQAIAALKASKIPFRLVHIPALIEFSPAPPYADENVGISRSQRSALIGSLTRMTGAEIAELRDHYTRSELAQPLLLVTTEQDWHPSLQGAAAMARALDTYLAATNALPAKDSRQNQPLPAR